MEGGEEEDVRERLLGGQQSLSEIDVEDDIDMNPVSFRHVLGQGKSHAQIKQVSSQGTPHWKRVLLLAVSIFVYLTFGAVVMTIAERGWGEHQNFLHGMYWAVATMQGIGYGDFVPLSTGTKLFVSFYLFLGVGFTVLASNINTQQDLTWLFDDYRADVQMCKKEIKSGKSVRSPPGWRTRLQGRDCYGWIWSFVSTVLFLVTGAVFLHLTEGGERFNLLNSFYFTAVTMTHVGYGDITPQHNMSKLFLVFFMLFAWGAYTVVLGKVAVYMLKKEHFWELEDWGKIREKNGGDIVKFTHFMNFSEKQLLEDRRLYRARKAEKYRNAPAKVPVEEIPLTRWQRISNDLSRRTLWGIFG